MRGRGLGSTPANGVIVIGRVFSYLQGKENGLDNSSIADMDGRSSNEPSGHHSQQFE